MYVFCNRSAHSSPPPHTAVPQSAHSVINAICSMALINRTLLTFYTWPARCLKLPHMPPPLSLFPSFPLFPSFFHLFPRLSTLDFFFFIPILLYIWLSGFHSTDFTLWNRLVKESTRSCCICDRILCPIFTTSFFKVNCRFQWRFGMCEHCVFSTDYLPMNMIKVKEHLCALAAAACVSVLDCLAVSCFQRDMRMHKFYKTWPFHTARVILHTLSDLCLTFFNRQTRNGFVKNSCRDSPWPQQSQAVTENMSIREIWLLKQHSLRWLCGFVCTCNVYCMCAFVGESGRKRLFPLVIAHCRLVE